MKKLLSVYFGNYRTYFSVITPTEKGFELKSINSINHTINSSNNDLLFEDTDSGIKEILNDFGKDIKSVSVSIPASAVHTAFVPQPSQMNYQDIKKLIELEIRLAYPERCYEDFIASAIPMTSKSGSAEYMLAVIIPKSFINSCKDFLSSLDIPIDNIEISQFTAHSALMYNYPERRKEAAVLINVDRKSLEISAVIAGKLAYYNFSRTSESNQIVNKYTKELEKIKEDYAGTIDSVYLFGEGLDFDLITRAKQELKNSVSNVFKLNAFRMLTTQLSEKHREYCSLMAHVFPPCIGSSLPAYHNKIAILK
ncbi:hypothetical protein ACFLSQ_07285 [Bacteroidota bacterium]